MEITLSLPKHEFNDTPTKTQLDNALGDIITFLNKVAGGYLANGEYTVADQPLAALLNATVQLRGAKDLFQNNTAGLAVPRPGPVSMPGRG
jgi:hypothetical protein